MLNLQSRTSMLLRNFTLMAVFLSGVISILASGPGSHGDNPAESFANAGRDVYVNEWRRIPLDGTLSQTPLSGALADAEVVYEWRMISYPESTSQIYQDLVPVIDDADSIRPSFWPNPYAYGEYVIQLHVIAGSHQAWDTVSVHYEEGEAQSLTPMARAGADRFVKHGSLVTLDGSKSHVFDMTATSERPLQYIWFMNKKPTDSTSQLSSTDGVTPGFIAEYKPDDLNGYDPAYSQYETQLNVVTAHDIASKPVHVKTYVFPPEGYVYPTPFAGPDQTVLAGSTVQLDGSESYDVDGRSLNYDWVFYSRPSGSHTVLQDAGTSHPYFIADEEGVYVVQLQASNEELSSIRIGPQDDFSFHDSHDFRYWKNLDYAGTDRVVITARTVLGGDGPDAGPDQLLFFNGPAAIPLDGSGSIDRQDDGIEYRWFIISLPEGSTATIDTPVDTQPDSASLLADKAGVYVIGLYTSIFSNEYDEVLITLTTDRAPAANAGNDQSASVGDLVSLDAGLSSDPDSDPLNYSWSLAEAPGDWGLERINQQSSSKTWVDWPALSGGRAIAPSFTPDKNGEYHLLLTVNDGELSSVMDEVIISVTGASTNTAPTADAGSDQTVLVGSTVSLSGAGSSDADNDALTYDWSMLSQPMASSAAIDDSSSPTPAFVADVEGQYEVQLVVNDGLDDSAPDSVMITAVTSSSCANPLELTTFLPFAPGVGEVPTFLQINAEGDDTLSARIAGDLLTSDVYQSYIPESSNLSQVNFEVFTSNWEEVSRSHANPISDSASPSFIVRNKTDNLYYKLNVEFTGTALLEVQIDALTGCRCGNSAAECPQ